MENWKKFTLAQETKTGREDDIQVEVLKELSEHLNLDDAKFLHDLLRTRLIVEGKI